MRLTVAGETPTVLAMCWPERRCRRKATTWSTMVGLVAARSRRGREERSTSPARPSAWNRATHLRAVRGQTPAARAAACGVCPTLKDGAHDPLSTERRQTGILMDVHPVLLGTLKCDTSSFLGPNR